MHILFPFDIVPVDSRIPQSAFGFSPSSERAVEYALEAYGAHDQLEVTAILIQRENPAVHGGRESRKLDVANHRTMAGWNPNV